jgi:hypothetical protein
LARASGRRYYRKGAEKADTGTSTSRSGQSMRNSKERLLDMMEAFNTSKSMPFKIYLMTVDNFQITGYNIDKEKTEVFSMRV